MSSPLTVRSTRKPWVTPSTKRTETGAAETGHSHSSTVTRTSKQSVAALVNNMTVEQRMCAPTGRAPALCHRRLRSLFQSTDLKVHAPPWLGGRHPKSRRFNPSSTLQFLTLLTLSFLRIRHYASLDTSVCSWAINGGASLLLTSAFLKIRIRKRSRILRVDFGFCLLGCFILLADSITLTESRFKSFKLFKSFKVDPIFDSRTENRVQAQ